MGTGVGRVYRVFTSILGSVVIVGAGAGSPAFATSSPQVVSATVFSVKYSTSNGPYNSQDFWNGVAYVPAAVNYQGTTYVPIRLVANLLGIGISFQTPDEILISTTQSPTLLGTPTGTPSTATGTSRLALVADRFFVNGTERTPADNVFFNGTEDVPTALQTDGTTYVPIRFVADLLNIQIAYTPGSPPIITLGRSSIPSETWQNLGPDPIPTAPPTNVEAQPVGVAYAPYSGRIDAVLLSPSGEIYVGSAGGGVWASTDSGYSWANLTPNISDLAIGALAIDPNNPNIIYAGTGEDHNCPYGCFPGDGVIKSTDGGRTWSPLLGRSQFDGYDTASIVVDPQNSEDVFLAGSKGIWESTDGGSAWSEKLSKPASDLVLVPGAPPILYAGVPGTGIEESVNGGATWTILSDGLPAPTSTLGFISLAVAPSNSSVIYAAIGQSQSGVLVGVYASQNGGATWTPLNVSDYFRGLGDYANVLAVDPSNSQVVYAGGMSLIQSTDGGHTWSTVAGYPSDNFSIHADFHALTFNPDGDLYIGNDGGIWEISSSGAVTDLNGNLSITQFYQGIAISPDGSTILIGSQDNGTVAYVTGKGWEAVLGGDGGWNAISPSGQEYIASDSKIYTDTSSTDGWATSWTDITPPFENTPFNAALALVSGTPPILLAGSDNVWRSQDGGSSWSRVTDVPQGSGSVTVIEAAPSNPDVIYAGWTGGLVMRSMDGGQTWAQISPSAWGFSCPDTASGYKGYTYDTTDISSIAVSPEDPNMVYVGIAEFSPLAGPADCAHIVAVSVAPSGRASWQDVTGNLPSAVNAILVHGSSLDVGTNIGVYTAEIGSNSWSPLGQGLPSVQVLGLETMPDGSILAATYGLGLWVLHQGSASPLP